MTTIRLRQLRDRTPIKLSLSLPPELYEALVDYGLLYEESYGAKEPIAELAVAMLAAFVDGDRGFARHRKRSSP